MKIQKLWKVNYYWLRQDEGNDSSEVPSGCGVIGGK